MRQRVELEQRVGPSERGTRRRKRPRTRTSCVANPAAVAARATRQLDLAEPGFDDLGRQRLALGQQDLLGRRGLRALVGVEELLVRASRRAACPTTSISMSCSGSSPESSIMARARSMIRIGSPMSSTNTWAAERVPRRKCSPGAGFSEPARMISCTASGIVMK